MKNFSLMFREEVKNSTPTFLKKSKQEQADVNVLRSLLRSKKVLLLLLSILLVTNSYSQTINFTKANPQPSLIEVYSGTFASGDIDGDGDKDLFMTGITPRQTKLYTNDGTGNFTEVATTFPTAGNSQAIFKDLDNDGDLDLYFSGQATSNPASLFTRIYKNNGSGVFTQVLNAGLPNILWRGAAIADVDNDGDQDIVMTGTGSGISGVYLNNGSAFFTLQANSPFAAVSGPVAFIDMENDGDQDVVISGGSSIKLYQNNGSGVFTLNNNSTFAAISGEDIDVADTDNDGDLDFLVNGNTQNLLYRNNGSGVFTQITTTFQATTNGANAIADLDNDGDQDVLIVGNQTGGGAGILNIAYRNTGNNVFVPADTLGGEYIADCVVDDFTGDGLKDIIIQGFSERTNVYWNTSSTALPLELLSFTGKVNDENIVLNWTTRDEVNTDYFIVESSNNGVSFSIDGTVRSMNNPSAIHNYQHQVASSVKGINYFRLKMVDKDGQFTYSNIIAIRLNALTDIKVYPTTTSANLNIYSAEEDQEVRLYNINGQYIQQVLNGHNDISHLPSGIYVVKTNDKTVRIVKQ
jgi:FG-GAP-like repeat/Secretion system C-terminal sorting domain